MRSPPRFLLGLLFLVGALAEPVGAQFPAQSYQLEPGDEVDIRFFTQAGDPLPAVMGIRYLDGTGRLYLPLVGSVEARGLDTNRLRALLVERYSAFFENPVLDVMVRLRVNVTGSVNQPNHYFIRPGSSVGDVIAAAGGTTPEAGGGFSGGSASDPSRVRLVRGDSVTILDLRPDAASTSGRNTIIQSGDWIHVPHQARARFRDDLVFASSILSVVGSVAALIILFTR